MNLIITVWVNLLSVLVVLLLMKYIFGADFRLNGVYTGIIAGTFFVYDLILESVSTGAIEALGVSVYMLVVLFVLSEKKTVRVMLHNIFYIVPAILFYVQMDSLVELVGRYLNLSQYTVPAIYDSVEILVLFADCLWITLLLRLGFMVRKNNMDLSLTKGEGIFFSVYCLFFPFYDVVYTRLEQEYQTSMYSAGAKMAWVVFCVVLNLAVILSIWNRKKSRFYHNLSMAYEKYYNAEYQHFQDYKSSQQKMDRFRHDLNNHFLVLRDLLELQQYDKATDYMKSLANDFSTDYYPVLTGNETIDTLIKMKYPLLKEKGIDFHFKGNMNCIDVMEPLDICIIFSNALDNAIEACEKVMENRYIEIDVKEGAHYNMLCLKNPLPDGQKKKLSLSVTSKKDTFLHGFGVQNIRMALAKYNGELSYRQEPQEMVTQIVFRKENHLSN